MVGSWTELTWRGPPLGRYLTLAKGKDDESQTHSNKQGSGPVYALVHFLWGYVVVDINHSYNKGQERQAAEKVERRPPGFSTMVASVDFIRMYKVVEKLRSELGQYSPYCQSKCTSNGSASGVSRKCHSPSIGRRECVGKYAKLNRRQPLSLG